MYTYIYVNIFYIYIYIYIDVQIHDSLSCDVVKFMSQQASNNPQTNGPNGWSLAIQPNETQLQYAKKS